MTSSLKAIHGSSRPAPLFRGESRARELACSRTLRAGAALLARSGVGRVELKRRSGIGPAGSSYGDAGTTGPEFVGPEIGAIAVEAGIADSLQPVELLNHIIQFRRCRGSKLENTHQIGRTDRVFPPAQ